MATALLSARHYNIAIISNYHNDECYSGLGAPGLRLLYCIHVYRQAFFGITIVAPPTLISLAFIIPISFRLLLGSCPHTCDLCLTTTLPYHSLSRDSQHWFHFFRPHQSRRFPTFCLILW